ncbi:MAG: putative acetyl esterase [Schumannella sp.]|nr:putative acetyl esterase [Schumannella sp.]
MPIHPWLAERFTLIRDIRSFDATVGDPVAGELFLRYLQDPQPWNPPDGVRVEDRMAGTVRVKVFRPASSAGPASALLWMHGGGFVLGSADDTESVIPGYELAARAGAVVVPVDYRLAVGGVRYPAPLDDTLAAWDWLTRNAADLGADPARLFVGGTSVGAALATAVAVRMRDSGRAIPRGMLLAYPIEHFPTPPLAPELLPALELLPAMLRFPAEYQLEIVQNYLGRTVDLPADAVPGNHYVAGLPEAWIAPAEYDDLRPSGELLAAQLTAAGVPAHLRIARGMVHGFLGRGPSLEPVSEILDFFAAALS